MNLSCNFFKGSFDVPRYIAFVDQYWTHLQALEAKQGISGYNPDARRSSSSGGGGDNSGGDKSKEE